MFSLNKNGIISVTRGDSFSIAISINGNTLMDPVPYVLDTGDYVYIGIMEPNQKFEDAILKKKLSKDNLNEDSDVIAYFSSADTQNLLPGKYYYQVKIQFADNEVNTIIDKTEFFIME